VKPTERVSLNPPLPEYIQWVIPKQKTLEEYNHSRTSNFWMARGVAISIWANKMEVSDVNCNWETIKQRVALYLNEVKISNETLVGGPDGEPGCGLYRISWAPELKPWLYEAKFQFTTDSGEELEFIWEFIIEK
jgi:hypothetical protein